MNSTKKQKPDYLNFGKYAMGGVGFSMTNMIVLTYLTFFCTDIFGISSLTVAGLMLVTKVIDAVTDPIMGFIADQTRSKSGRYRPHLIYGSPILGILIYLLFSAPELSAGMKIYSFTSSILRIPWPLPWWGSRSPLWSLSWQRIPRNGPWWYPGKMS